MEEQEQSKGTELPSRLPLTQCAYESPVHSSGFLDNCAEVCRDCDKCADCKPTQSKGRSFSPLDLGEASAVRVVAFDAIAKKGGADKRTLWDFIGEKKGREIIKKNVRLIRTIDKKKFPLIVRGIVKVFKGKMTREELTAEIERVGEVDGVRANIIADDQLAKATVVFQLARWRQNGWRMVMWRHNPNVTEPRDYHKRKWDGVSGLKDGRPNGLNGFVFPMNKPPVIDEKTGERGYPAQLINCSCYLVPVK